MEPLWHALGVTLAAGATVLHAFGGYLVLLFLLSKLGGSARRPAEAKSEPRTRLAALVVAHDEENVVRESLSTLARQSYPRDGFEVFCVADRCSDRTAAVAREEGATVLERTSGRGGKAAAVAFGVAAIRERGSPEFDAIAVFDADNAVDPRFLERVAARIAGGERVVQGFVDSKNPGASWVAGSSALGFWALAETTQAPREALGLSAPLMGTGFALRAAEAARFLGDASALTDDLELGARLAVEGIRVAYAADARTVDEKPVLLGTAVSQRHRWMQGRWAVAGRYLPKLLGRALLPGGGSASGAHGADGMGVRLRALDMAYQLVAPSLLFVGVGLAFVAFLQIAARAAHPVWAAEPALPDPVVSLGLAALFYALPAVGIARHRPSARVWLYYALQPAYLAWSVPLGLTGWLFRGGSRWARTPKGEAPPPPPLTPSG